MVENYHRNLIKNIKMILAVMGLKNVTQLDKSKLMLVDESGNIKHDIKRVMEEKVSDAPLS
jgi:isopentenyl diphosphate isomerase/L-lactate dehydrogenase-like FMN-dependent dehydrogenase